MCVYFFITVTLAVRTVSFLIDRRPFNYIRLHVDRISRGLLFYGPRGINMVRTPMHRLEPDSACQIKVKFGLAWKANLYIGPQ